MADLKIIAQTNVTNVTVDDGNNLQVNVQDGNNITIQLTPPADQIITIDRNIPGTVVSSVTAAAPITSTGGLTPQIGITQATTSTDGYLNSTDWNTFNNKGTVNSVIGTGSVSGIELTGTVTSTGNITLGGALDLSSPPIIGDTTPNEIYASNIIADTAEINTETILTQLHLNSYGGIAPVPVRFRNTSNVPLDLISSPSQASAYQLILPPTTGTVNQVLQTDGNGVTSWTTLASGGVTSVSGTGSVNGITLSGTVTSTGNLTLGGSLSGVSLTSQVSGTLPIANGGTNSTTAGGALSNLGGIGTITSTDGSVTVSGTGTSRDLSVAVAGSTTNVICQVRNTTGATLTKGTAVYISGATGQIPTVSKASAATDPTSAQTLGLINADLANNTNGYVTIIGLITNIDTSAYTDGAQLYLSYTTAGALTATKPKAPNHLVYVAVVEHAHPTQGKLFVKVQNGYELDELHDVQITSPANGQTIIYDATTSLWKNANLTAGSGISITNGASSVTVAANFASPPAIGNTTPNAITGTTITANTAINLPAVTNIGSTTGIIEMIDGGDGNDYIDIYTFDGTNKIPVQFSGGATLRSAGVVTGRIAFADPTNTYYGVVTFPDSLATNLTITLPGSTGSANQVLKTDGSGNTSWVTQGVQGTAPVTVTTATYTVAATNQWIIGNRAGTITLTLPTASSSTGRSLNIKTIQAQTVVSASSNVVPLNGGAAGTAILAATIGKYATLVSDGTNWIIMGAN